MRTPGFARTCQVQLHIPHLIIRIRHTHTPSASIQRSHQTNHHAHTRIRPNMPSATAYPPFDHTHTAYAYPICIHTAITSDQPPCAHQDSPEHAKCNCISPI